jgi:hypothetical protein
MSADAPEALPPVPDPDDPATDAVVARHARTLPGWAARWDARMLEARRRLAVRAPGVHRWLLATLTTAYLVTDAVLPRRRLRVVTVAMLAATVLDSIATYVWVSRQVALEGNPVVASVMGLLGDGPGLFVRTLLSASFVVALAWLARRHWEARAGLAVAAVALAGITVVHAYGLWLTLTMV